MSNLQTIIKAVSIGTTAINMATMVADEWLKEKKMEEKITKEVAKKIAQLAK